MKKFVYRSVFLILVFLLLFVALHEVVPATTSRGPSNGVIVIEEHPWDILNRAVKIEVIAVMDDIVILLVWFDLEEPPVVVQVNRDAYESGHYVSQKRLIKKILSIFLE